MKPYFLFILIIFGPVSSFSQNTSKKVVSKDTFIIETPDLDTRQKYIYLDSINKAYPPYDLLEFVRENLRFSSIVRDQDTVLISFDIDKAGAVKEPIVLDGVSRLIDDEVVRVIKMLPAWIPAKKGDIPFYYTVRLKVPVKN